jgi:hypothetical protein
VNDSTPVTVVDDSWNSPRGRKPLSASTSHSKPSVWLPGASVLDWPAPRLVTAVLRQRRMFLYVEGTVMSDEPELTTNSWPVSAFCGRPPSPGGLNRGSAHVPVHATGSVAASKWVSLYVVSVRYGVEVPSALLACQRVFQNTSFPLKKARLTPASRAASILARSGPDQYSSCPLETISL